MAELSISSVVRDILTSDPEMPSDEVIRRAKARGLRVTDEQIRKSVNNQRNAIRAKVSATTVAPLVASETAPPKAAPAVPASAATAGTPDLAGVLGNVALVNTVVGLCGGVKNARQTAEAVQACGGLAGVPSAPRTRRHDPRGRSGEVTGLRRTRWISSVATPSHSRSVTCGCAWSNLHPHHPKSD